MSSNKLREALIYPGCGTDLDPIIHSDQIHVGASLNRPILLFDPGNIATSFYVKLRHNKEITSKDYEYLKPKSVRLWPSFFYRSYTIRVIHEGFFTDSLKRKTQSYEKRFKLPDQTSEAFPQVSDPSDTDNIFRDALPDWMELEIQFEENENQPKISDGLVRRFRYLPYGLESMREILRAWKMKPDTLVLTRQNTLFDIDQQEELPIHILLKTNPWWIETITSVWTDRLLPWMNGEWLPSLRTLGDESDFRRGNVQLRCLNRLSSIRELNASEDIFWWDPEFLALMTHESLPLDKTPNIHEIPLEKPLPSQLQYVLDIRASHCSVYKVEDGKLILQHGADHSALRNLIQFQSEGISVVIRGRDLTECFDTVLEALQINRVNTRVIRQMLDDRY